MTEIYCLGEALIELNQQADGRYLSGFGGDTSNVAIAAARQGAKVGYISQVGTDAFGDSLLSLWRDEHVNVDHVRRIEAPTGLYFVTHGVGGHAFSYRRAGSAASLMTTSDLPLEALAACKVLHASGISQAISANAADGVFDAMQAVKSAGGLVSYDPNLRLKLWPLTRARAIIHEAMAMCDIALPGLDDAELLTGLRQPDAIVDFYLELGAQVVALTLGAQGCLVATPQARQRLASHQVNAVDATGAGDTYDGVFLAHYVKHGDPFEAGKVATAAAALSTQGYGAIAPMPHAAQVAAFMNSAE